MSRVCVLSNQLRINDKGKLVSKFNVKDAERYGTIEFLLGASCDPRVGGNDILQELHDNLCDFTEKDFLLPIGNPVLIGWATSIASHYCRGTITILSWDRDNRRYEPITADLR